MAQNSRPLAVVTGASTGIGYELAKCCAQDGLDLVVVADEPEIKKAARISRPWEPRLTLCRLISRRSRASISFTPRLVIGRSRRCWQMPDAASAKVSSIRTLMTWFASSTNITGTVYLIQKVARDMRMRGRGRILITGSIAGFVPGTYQAVYNASKAFLDSFSFALRAELKDTGITVTCLMPGATETEFFARADMLDTKVGQGKKDDAADVARTGFKAMMKGAGDVVTGWHNKLQSAIANVTPASVLAEQHRKKAEPGSAAQH
jgi:uncharacterized protein